MAIIKIDSCKTSKSGKSLNVKSGESWYLAKLDSGIDKLVGQTIDCETETTNFNGADLTWINKYRVYTQAPSAAMAQTAIAQAGDLMKFMPFISNTVAHAIQAARIENPADIRIWAKAAYETALALEKSNPDEDFPF